ncbi:MAG: PAS domain-containing methyl-accepting chemotaxis protein [Gallionella sp.]|nr:PAS domain-containing methyl-accepting chemotaxis protein [Gallionella sp.]
MKINLPVTNIAREVDPVRPIVSETNLKGEITYVNDAFIAVSGFDREALIGKNHNIVRHPDMPPEAFADLWNTIKAGRPWRGIVKNRCKNGDYYWVEAYVTGIHQNGKLIGYKSVRSKPSQPDIRGAEALYRRVADKQATLTPTMSSSFMERLSLQFRVNAGLAALVILLASSAVMNESPLVSIALIAAGIFVAILTSHWTHQSVGVPVKAAIAALQKIAEGNLNHRLTFNRDDEIAHLSMAIESMRINLRAIIVDVFAASGIVANSTVETERLIAQLSENFVLQTDRVSSIRAALEQMSLSISDVVNNTSAATEFSSQVTSVVESGKQLMTQNLHSSKKTEGSVIAASGMIHDLNVEMQKIGQITQTINEIAAQTNLLALNAAIEAARAGESGRGFAVVADEVRKLAERTSNSTVDITRMVEQICTTTGSVVSIMDAAVDDVKLGMEHIHASDEKLHQILTAANSACAVTQSVAVAFMEQKTAANDVSKNMEQICSMTDSNHSSLGAIDDGMKNLAYTSSELAHLVKHFEHSIRA